MGNYNVRIIIFIIVTLIIYIMGVLIEGFYRRFIYLCLYLGRDMNK